MSTFQKFIQYYKPYKKVFIFDLICAAFISLVDLAYPQILRSLTKTLFLKDASMILKTLPIIGGILFICYIFQAFCKYYVFNTEWYIIIGIFIAFSEISLAPQQWFFITDIPDIYRKGTSKIFLSSHSKFFPYV